MGNADALNRTLFIADNLPVLRGIDSESVDLIATDPPFNKGVKAFEGIVTAGYDKQGQKVSYKDIWTWRDVQQEWVDRITEDHPALKEVIEAANTAGGEDMGAFLCWLAVRVLEMHRVLKPTGSMYLHVDHTAHAYVKTMMDAIFDRKNFRNEIVWQRTRGRSDGRQFGRVHDTILFYSKSRQYQWNTQFMEYDPQYVARAYGNKDDRGHWQSDQLTANSHGRTEGEYLEPWRGVSLAAGRMWNLPMKGGMAEFIEENGIPEWKAMSGVHERLDALDAAGFIAWPKGGRGMPRLKRYLQTVRGVAPGDVFTDIGKLEGASKEKMGYPTQKPLALYERIIKASSNPGDLVLDPFAGCATTCVAAERWGRRWIAIDVNAEAENIIRRRLKQEVDENMNWNEDVQTSSAPPDRTDGGAEAAPELTLVSPRPKAPRLTARQLRERLIIADGEKCQGCGWIPPRTEYLEVDHRIPKSLGGPDNIRNRVLLCAPCNGVKGNKLTLAELRERRIREGLMLDTSWDAAWYQRIGRFG